MKNSHYSALRLVMLVALITLAGCSKRYNDMPVFSPFPLRDYPNYSVGRFKTSYLADQIDAFYHGTDPGPLGVTSLVNIDDLYSTSTFGRMYSEQIMSELAMRGYQVVELRHSDALHFLASEGEFALSRDLGTVRRSRQLGGIIVGTYVVSPVRIYVNMRLVDPATSSVLSAGSVEMEKTQELARLVKSKSQAPNLERIPVRHLGLGTYAAEDFGSSIESKSANSSEGGLSLGDRDRGRNDRSGLKLP